MPLGEHERASQQGVGPIVVAQDEGHQRQVVECLAGKWMVGTEQGGASGQHFGKQRIGFAVLIAVDVQVAQIVQYGDGIVMMASEVGFVPGAYAQQEAFGLGKVGFVHGNGAEREPGVDAECFGGRV